MKKQEKNKIKNLNKKKNIIMLKNTKGITLITLVVTIIVLIILAGVSINLILGDNGIVTKAKESKKAQIIAEAKEKIGVEILAAQIEATERNEELEQTQIADIISKYGELQEDGDTIILKDNGYNVSLLEIYNGTVTSTGSYSELKAQNALLKQQLEDASKSQSESSKELSELKQSISNAKTLIASTITDKGVTTSADATFENIVNNIKSIKTTYTVTSQTIDCSSGNFRTTSYFSAKPGYTLWENMFVVPIGVWDQDNQGYDCDYLKVVSIGYDTNSGVVTTYVSTRHHYYKRIIVYYLD